MPKISIQRMEFETTASVVPHHILQPFQKGLVVRCSSFVVRKEVRYIIPVVLEECSLLVSPIVKRRASWASQIEVPATARAEAAAVAVTV
jgi:hypothetical protein